MKTWLARFGLVLLLAPSVASAAGPDPREKNFHFLVDGTQIDGVVGFRIDFTQMPSTPEDQRRLGVSYAPDQRRLVITVTQTGLNRLQDWLNSATDSGAPTSKTVEIQALDNQSNLLARWQLTDVAPSTFSSAVAGNINEVDATVEFAFDKLKLVEARK